MIYGTGIDIVDVDRIDQAYQRWGEKFPKKFLREEEIEISLSLTLWLLVFLNKMCPDALGECSSLRKAQMLASGLGEVTLEHLLDVEVS